MTNSICGSVDDCSSFEHIWAILFEASCKGICFTGLRRFEHGQRDSAARVQGLVAWWGWQPGLTTGGFSTCEANFKPQGLVIWTGHIHGIYDLGVFPEKPISFSSLLMVHDRILGYPSQETRCGCSGSTFGSWSLWPVLLSTWPICYIWTGRQLSLRVIPVITAFWAAENSNGFSAFGDVQNISKPWTPRDPVFVLKSTPILRETHIFFVVNLCWMNLDVKSSLMITNSISYINYLYCQAIFNPYIYIHIYMYINTIFWKCLFPNGETSCPESFFCRPGRSSRPISWRSLGRWTGASL